MAHLAKRLTRKNCGVAGLSYGCYYLYKDTIRVNIIRDSRSGKVFVAADAYPMWCDYQLDQKYIKEVYQAIVRFESTWNQQVVAVDLEELGKALECLYQQLKKFEKSN